MQDRVCCRSGMNPRGTLWGMAKDSYVFFDLSVFVIGLKSFFLLVVNATCAIARACDDSMGFFFSPSLR